MMCASGFTVSAETEYGGLTYQQQITLKGNTVYVGYMG